jgi:hypothetical protein
MISDEVVEKFWTNVEKADECWNWTGRLDKKHKPMLVSAIPGSVGPRGYSKYREYSARRISLELTGIILDEKHPTHITCGNNLCVNPEHIIYGEEARFWSKVIKLNDNDCWIWIGAYSTDHYGKFTFTRKDGSKGTRAHIYSWQLANDRELLRGMVICHRCDNTLYVNTDHLTLGTPMENSLDMVYKNRQAKGEKNGSVKMNEEKVIQLRELRKSGMTLDQLSQEFGLSKSATYSIISGQTWKYLLQDTDITLQS